ncbi:hypothetical protein KO02_15690 [Sphingobacterium sp. ML3W]|uniref:hypothetical protein n=1 Tax=Sphingobacterium sp. ML3W TaxID=1538644 RepID=UPI0004F5AF97|nr:hypothetical protein [Sphingobacterium sp. ML3W]AIM37971.1 hypothetical protein KO02_15690 [Sphingobacterium sp. ML3W]
MSYISSIDRKRDYINTLAYAKKEGRLEGEKHGRTETEAKAYAEKLASAKKMLARGIEKDEISEILELSIEEIEKL